MGSGECLAEGGLHLDEYRSCMGCLHSGWCALMESGWQCTRCLSPDALARFLA